MTGASLTITVPPFELTMDSDPFNLGRDITTRALLTALDEVTEGMSPADLVRLLAGALVTLSATAVTVHGGAAGLQLINQVASCFNDLSAEDLRAAASSAGENAG